MWVGPKQPSSTRITYANKVTFFAFILVEEAKNWWRFTKQQLENEGRQITWEIFKKKFMNKYFPDDLSEGTMFIGEYAAKFDELSKIYPYYFILL